MTVQIPSTWPIIGPREYAGRAPIQAPDWGALCESLHYLYERRGIVLGGRIWDSGLTTAENTTVLCGVPTRILDGGWKLVASAYGDDFSAEFNVVNLEDSSTNIATLTASDSSGTTDWYTDTSTESDADVRDDGTTSGSLALMAVGVDITFNAGGVLYQVALSALRDLSPSDIPTEI
jgi:hypothetical protein